MRNTLLALFAASLFAACSSDSKPAARVYNATASVGDFLLITIHPDTHRIDYENRTTGESGTVDYTVNADGTYAITDPDGHLLTAYEIPGLALVMGGDKMGPGGTEKALIIGVEKASLTKADLAGKSYTIMQFRTTEGGMEVGHVAIDSSFNLRLNEYIPAKALYGSSPYVNESEPSTNFTDDPISGSITAHMTGDTYDSHVFGTPGGYFAVDCPNGSIFGIREAASSAFQSSSAGTYTAIVYSRKNVTMTPGSGTPEMSTATVTVTEPQAGTGHIVVTQGSQTIFDEDLIPFAQSSFTGPVGSGRVESDAKGLFVFGDSSDSPIFVTFMDRSLAFASFTAGTGQYNYTYGFALKQP